ncbi:LLM class flavin-dependent oxidoreductase [Nonomuraea rhizosphaerae]|uniref:LLM class flavin-dependent oxidoreductase n=1 Tax=Nonomuraea rhizosphaerae TaxID=2665663 RepID=UPI001C5DB468|nr:LLM class flavin-dependent oxidoreductase [Nonomuraea rhizosphaerae]
MLSFGIKTLPLGVPYEELVRIWRQADAVPAIEHAWLWDHMLPIFGPVETPIYEGWTMLAALAAQTSRLKVGLMVTSNLTRPPAVLAKIASTVDVIAPGRLVLGLGVGGTRLRGDTIVPREYNAYGLTVPTPAEGRARLAESCTIIRRMFTEERFDFDGRYYQLKDVVCEPKPAVRPPLLLGGWGDNTLGVVAEHADIWNVPGPPHNTVAFLRDRSKLLDEKCAAIGRDPSEIVRSTQIVVTPDDVGAARSAIGELAEIGLTHFVLGVRTAGGGNVAEWLAEEIIEPATR